MAKNLAIIQKPAHWRQCKKPSPNTREGLCTHIGLGLSGWWQWISHQPRSNHSLQPSSASKLHLTASTYKAHNIQKECGEYNSRVKFKSLRSSKVCEPQITSRMLTKCHYIPRSLFLEEKSDIQVKVHVNGMPWCIGKIVILNICQDMARMVYMLVSACFHHDEAELLLHKVWFFLWTCEISMISLMCPHVAQTQ